MLDIFSLRFAGFAVAKVAREIEFFSLGKFSRSPRRPSGIKLEPFQFRELHLKENILVPLVI